MPHVHKLEQRMSAEVVAALVSDYKSGMTSTGLRAKYELGKGSVQRLLREAKVRRRRHSLTNVEIVGLVQRYEAGLTIREIAGDKGLPKTTVQNALKRSGLRRRPAARRDGISQRKQ